MIKNDLNGFNFHEEKLILEKIQINNREIHPLVRLSIFYTESGLTTVSMNPLAWLVHEGNSEDIEASAEKYILLFDGEFEKEPENLFNYFEEHLK